MKQVPSTMTWEDLINQSNVWNIVEDYVDIMCYRHSDWVESEVVAYVIPPNAYYVGRLLSTHGSAFPKNYDYGINYQGIEILVPLTSNGELDYTAEQWHANPIRGFSSTPVCGLGGLVRWSSTWDGIREVQVPTHLLESVWNTHKPEDLFATRYVPIESLDYRLSLETLDPIARRMYATSEGE